MSQDNLALLATLEAKPEKADEVATFLTEALPLAEQEHETSSWFALRLGETTFGIFDTFADESGRDAHLSGAIASALMQKAPELLAADPDIRKVDVLAAKLPG